MNKKEQILAAIKKRHLGQTTELPNTSYKFWIGPKSFESKNETYTIKQFLWRKNFIVTISSDTTGDERFAKDLGRKLFYYGITQFFMRSGSFKWYYNNGEIKLYRISSADRYVTLVVKATERLNRFELKISLNFDPTPKQRENLSYLFMNDK